jgi:hypothetical protein
LEDWKIKISVLWIVYEFGGVWLPMLELYLPGFIEEIISGEMGGSPITPELLLILAILMLIAPVMAFLSLTLKNTINRWANIILGIIFAGFALVFPIEYLAEQSAYSAFVILIGIVDFVAAALIVWYAWKSKQKA